MPIKTLLNKVERFKSFIYGTTQIMLVAGADALVIGIARFLGRQRTGHQTVG